MRYKNFRFYFYNFFYKKVDICWKKYNFMLYYM